MDGKVWMMAAIGLAALGCSGPQPSARGTGESEDLQIVDDLDERLARYAPTELGADLSVLPPTDAAAVAPLLRAARAIDEIFLRQAWGGNPALRERLQALPGARGDAAREYFAINYGPWDRLDGFAPWLGRQPHPDGAGYYPEDLDRQGLEDWLAGHPEARSAITSLTTVVRRRDGELEAVPYSEVYREWLTRAAEELREAARATGNASLRRFLELRAEAFASDDYLVSDMAWMDLDSPLEITIGPYETYEDGLFGYKAAFEAYVTVALPAESAKLERFKQELPWLERNLPIPDEHKNLDRGTDSPIRVADVLYAAGDGNAGVQAIAFNLPNDERVREAKGSKKVLLHNIMRAKYDAILVPIAERVLTPEGAGRVSFDAFFQEVLHHELGHGLGPGRITVGGRETEVRLELKDLYSTLEEAKADVMGVYDLLALAERGVVSEELLPTLESTYLAGLFRAARFGIHEAHGQGVVSQFNYLEAKGALEIDSEGRFHPVSERFGPAIRDLLHDLLMLQATGDYVGAARFLERWGQPGPSLLAAVERLEDLPVDVRPLYRQAEGLLGA